MSSINSIASSGLANFIQSVSSNNATPSAPPATTITNSTATQSTGGRHHHHHGAGAKAIQNAVTTALQSAQSSGSNEDPNKIVEDAIAKVFKSHLTSPSQATDSDSDSNAEASASSPTDANSAQSAFLQTLQQFGVTPEQFQSDLLSAVKDAQQGQSNSATAFQSFTPGSIVDILG